MYIYTMAWLDSLLGGMYFYALCSPAWSELCTLNTYLPFWEWPLRNYNPLKIWLNVYFYTS